jgi:inosose dehydratase
MPGPSSETRYATVTEYIIEALRDDILTDKLQPGQKLPLDALATRFGTSVIPVREALRVLEAERLVERRPHRTATVSALSLETIQDLYRVRLILDVEAVRMAHGRLSSDKLAELRTLIDRMERAAERREGLKSFALHQQIHFGIYEASGSPALVNILGTLWDDTERFRHAVKHFRSDVHTWAEEHRDLVDLLEHGSAEEAAGAMHEHLSKTLSALTTARSRLRLGSAPDSWGVWFADDPVQTPWNRFLDELAEAGYRWVELGPYGYLPTDPGRLQDELDQRGLTLSGGTVGGGLHRGDAFEEVRTRALDVARLVSGLGARHLVFLPEMYRSLDGTGTYLQPADLDSEAWRRLVSSVSELGKIVRDTYGVKLAFHPHADSHVETQDEVRRLLDGTDSDSVWLCLDTGHIAYGGGDNLALIREFPDRIGYVHLKQVDPGVLDVAKRERLSFADAVRRGVMCEPPNGAPAMEPIISSLHELDTELFAIVEHDLYPCDPDEPLPIAERTRRFFNNCGIGSALDPV